MINMNMNKKEIEKRIESIESAIKILKERSIEHQDAIAKNNDLLMTETDVEKRKALEAENEQLVSYIVTFREVIDNETKNLEELKAKLAQMND
jgi:hypothetical protein